MCDPSVVRTIRGSPESVRTGGATGFSITDGDVEAGRESTCTTTDADRSNDLPVGPVPDNRTAPRLLLTPEEAADCLSIGRTTVYALMASKQLPSIRIGRSRRIPLKELRVFVERALG
jgi:excisionase family DNA binding protein